MAVKYVRVYLPDSNADVTVPEAFAKVRGLKILDKAAVNKYGKPLPAKPHEPLGKPKNAPRRAGGEADETATSTTEATKEAQA